MEYGELTLISVQKNGNKVGQGMSARGQRAQPRSPALPGAQGSCCPPGTPWLGPYLADAVDAHVPAGVHFVARGPIDDSVPQLFCEVFVLRAAVQLTGVNWGAEQTETEPEEPGSARLHSPAFCSSVALGSHGQVPPSLHVTISDNTN